MTKSLWGWESAWVVMLNPEWASWCCTAAYLYILQLDGPSLAWEYLRRNPRYRDDWQRYRRRQSVKRSHRWGLRQLEDPSRDARVAAVDWIPDPDTIIRLQADDDPSADAPRFRLWRVPGRKILIHDGKRLLLVSFVKGRVIRIVISGELRDGQLYAYTVPANTPLYRRWRALEEQTAILKVGDLKGLHGIVRRADRTSMTHMRSLQALDGVLLGASQRQVAEALFGIDAVAERWHPDSELRAQVRHLIRRGREYADGGYRRLLQFADAKPGGERNPAESP